MHQWDLALIYKDVVLYCVGRWHTREVPAESSCICNFFKRCLDEKASESA